MMREHGWEERLIAAVAEWQEKPFAWGKADCAGFALACVKAVRGKMPRGLKPPRYTTATGARMALEKMGFADLAAVMASTFEEIAPVMAGRGDIGIVISNGAQCAVVNTGLWWAGKTEQGLIRVPHETVTRAFRV